MAAVSAISISVTVTMMVTARIRCSRGVVMVGSVEAGLVRAGVRSVGGRAWGLNNRAATRKC